MIVMEMEARSFKGADSAKTDKLEGPVKERTRKVTQSKEEIQPWNQTLNEEEKWNDYIVKSGA